MTMEQLHADIPPELADADDAMTRYGRWAAGRWSPRRCGSAEGHYRPRVRGDEAREPAAPVCRAGEAASIQAALMCVPERPRRVLFAIYVPQRLPLAARLRHLQIAPREARGLHLLGLRTFAQCLACGVQSAPMLAGSSAQGT